MVVALPLKAGLPLALGVPEGQKLLPFRILAQTSQTAVGLPSSFMQVEPRQAVSWVIFHSGVPCIPG